MRMRATRQSVIARAQPLTGQSMRRVLRGRQNAVELWRSETRSEILRSLAREFRTMPWTTRLFEVLLAARGETTAEAPALSPIHPSIVTLRRRIWQLVGRSSRSPVLEAGRDELVNATSQALVQRRVVRIQPFS